MAQLLRKAKTLGPSFRTPEPARKTLLVSLLVGVVLALSFAAGSAVTSADSGSATFDYHIGDAFLKAIDPSLGPAVVMSPHGDRLILEGSGALTVHPKSVTGGGTFVHLRPDGSELGHGTWTATELIMFNSYGTQDGLPSDVEGGLAHLRVHLAPSVGGPGLDVVLQIESAIGKAPNGHEEGIREGNLNREVSGGVRFVRH